MQCSKIRVQFHLLERLPVHTGECKNTSLSAPEIRIIKLAVQEEECSCDKKEHILL